MAFGFAPPIQSRLPPPFQPQQAQQAPNPAADPGSFSDSMGQIRSGLQHFGIGSPQPGPITAPAMPVAPGIEDASGAISGAVGNMTGGSAAASAGADALSSGGPGFMSWLASLFA